MITYIMFFIFGLVIGMLLMALLLDFKMNGYFKEGK